MNREDQYALANMLRYTHNKPESEFDSRAEYENRISPSALQFLTQNDERRDASRAAMEALTPEDMGLTASSLRAGQRMAEQLQRVEPEFIEAGKGPGGGRLQKGPDGEPLMIANPAYDPNREVKDPYGSNSPYYQELQDMIARDQAAQQGIQQSTASPWHSGMGRAPGTGMEYVSPFGETVNAPAQTTPQPQAPVQMGPVGKYAALPQYAAAIRGSGNG